jgi:hypothetical protein
VKIGALTSASETYEVLMPFLFFSFSDDQTLTQDFVSVSVDFIMIEYRSTLYSFPF